MRLFPTHTRSNSTAALCRAKHTIGLQIPNSSINDAVGQPGRASPPFTHFGGRASIVGLGGFGGDFLLTPSPPPRHTRARTPLQFPSAKSHRHHPNNLFFLSLSLLHITAHACGEATGHFLGRGVLERTHKSILGFLSLFLFHYTTILQLCFGIGRPPRHKNIPRFRALAQRNPWERIFGHVIFGTTRSSLGSVVSAALFFFSLSFWQRRNTPKPGSIFSNIIGKRMIPQPFR